MTAITGGDIVLKDVKLEDINPILHKLQESNCKIKAEDNNVFLTAPKRLRALDIKTMPHPGFPTDMQSIFAAMLTTAKGTSIVVENIFENRYRYVSELGRMGAKITVEGRAAIIKGTKKLIGTEVKSTDLRGGAAMCTAALAAKGVTTIGNIEYILRGYENLDKKLSNLGANITKKMEK